MHRSTAIGALAACLTLRSSAAAGFRGEGAERVRRAERRGGPHIGALAPPLEASIKTERGRLWRSISGPKGAILIFNLSADT